MRATGYLLSAAAIVALAACGSEAPRAEAPAARSPSPATALPVADSARWAVSPTGAGPVRVGMTLGQLAPLLRSLADTVGIGDGCGYVSVEGAPDSLGFMVEGRRLVRVEVRGGRTPTAAGARIGDPERRIEALYPGQVRVEPHKYTAGHYLVVIPGAPSDTLHRLVFETDGRRVTLYRAGLFPPVAYVEGCS